MRRVMFSVACVLLVACGDDGGGDPDIDAAANPDAVQADAAPPDAPPGTPVNGTMIVHHVDVAAGATVDQPTDLSAHELSALIPDGEGGFAERTGSGAADGTFSIPDVPDGDYYLRVLTPGGAPYYLVTSSHTIDLGSWTLGRTARTGVTMPSDLIFTAGALDPWTSTDNLELFVPESGANGFYVETSASAGLPGDGDTTLTGLTVDWSAIYGEPWLIESADHLMLLQLATLPDAGTGTVVRALTKRTDDSGLVQQDGVELVIGTDFFPVTRDEDFVVTVAVPEFAALAADVTPGATGSQYAYLFVDALPDAANLGFYASAPDLLIVDLPADATEDVPVAAAYGGFTGWDRFYAIEHDFSRSYTAPGATSPRTIWAGKYYQEASIADLPASLAPTLGPARSITVGGQPASADITGVGVTPTVAWEPPALGTADIYRVGVYRLYASSGNTAYAWNGSVMTTGTSVVLPPGLMEAGQAYAIVLTAYATPNVDVTVAPWVNSFPTTLVSAMTAMIQP